MANNQDLKKGDLCVIIGGLKGTFNVGKSVTLQMFLPAGRTGDYEGKLFQAPPEDAWIVTGEGLTSWNIRQGFFITDTAGSLARFLMKIGDGNPDIVKQTEKEKPVCA